MKPLPLLLFAAWLKLGILVWTPLSGSPSRVLPDFGLMLNDDGDFSFIADDPEESIQLVQASVDALMGTPVRTLLYSIGAGSDVLYYPTDVASVWGWRETKLTRMDSDGESEETTWGVRTRRIVAGMRANIDPIRVAGERARENGLYFLPSYRMNDDHFIFDPFEYPLTGRFWIDNHEKLTIRDSPIESERAYGNLLNFTHDKVREYRLGVIRETIERYEDIIDGIQLDFNRLQVLFPKGKAEERAHLVTELMREVRILLDEAGARQGRDLALMARVPPSPRNCRWAGLDIETWVEEELVDVLLPAQLMTLAHDMPVDAFVEISRRGNTRVYPSLYPRTSWHFPFSATPSPEDFTAPAIRHVSPELVRGAAATYWEMGASGFELFNYHHEDRGRRPFSDRVYRIMRDLAHPRSLNGADQIYAITPAYYLDHEDSYQYRKQIPVRLIAGNEIRLTLLTGQAGANKPSPRDAFLRIGFRDANRQSSLQVRLNGEPLHDGKLSGLFEVIGSVPATAPEAYFQLPIQDFHLRRQGPNELSLALGAGDAKPIEVMEVWLAIIYDRHYLDKLITPPGDPAD